VHVGFEALTAAVMKSSIESQPTFWKNIRFHLQCRRISQESTQNEAGSKHRLAFNGVHGFISRKTELLIGSILLL
jgi:hypothetical protein